MVKSLKLLIFQSTFVAQKITLTSVNRQNSFLEQIRLAKRLKKGRLVHQQAGDVWAAVF